MHQSLWQKWGGHWACPPQSIPWLIYAPDSCGKQSCYDDEEEDGREKTWLAKTRMSSLKESDEQTSAPGRPTSRGVHVASSHFSKTRASSGNNGWLKPHRPSRHIFKFLQWFLHILVFTTSVYFAFRISCLCISCICVLLCCRFGVITE